MSQISVLLCQAGQLTDLWSAALAQGAVGKAAALDSARSVLNQGLSLTPQNANAGMSAPLSVQKLCALETLAL